MNYIILYYIYLFIYYAVGISNTDCHNYFKWELIVAKFRETGFGFFISLYNHARINLVNSIIFIINLDFKVPEIAYLKNLLEKCSCVFHAMNVSFLPFPGLQNMAYYKISHVDDRINNPEQRIASDIPRFCSELSELVQEDLTAVIDGLLYTWRLCSYASPKYVLWILVLFFLLCSFRFDASFSFCYG